MHLVMTEAERLTLLRLARTENVGPISFFHLLKRYGTAEEALRRLPTTARTKIIIPSMEDIKREYAAHQKKGYALVSYYDPSYPAPLRTLKDPPPFISIRGNLSLANKTLFAIVGARNASQAGEKIADQITADLSKERWIIVSGLARGIDTCVHKAAVAHGTVAVIAGGVDHIYPPENKNLFHDIAEQGMIISEDPIDQPLHAALFPKRNRLISGLSWGTLIIEATSKSGSLLTGQYALEQNRALFAVPGHPLDPRSRGVNRLLKQGAILVESAQDVLEECGTYQTRIHLAQEEEEEYTPLMPYVDSCDMDMLYKRIQEALTLAPTPIHELAQHLDLSPVVVRTLLVEMELDGVIDRYPGDAVMLAVKTA